MVNPQQCIHSMFHDLHIFHIDNIQKSLVHMKRHFRKRTRYDGSSLCIPCHGQRPTFEAEKVPGGFTVRGPWEMFIAWCQWMECIRDNRKPRVFTIKSGDQ